MLNINQIVLEMSTRKGNYDHAIELELIQAKPFQHKLLIGICDGNLSISEICFLDRCFSSLRWLDFFCLICPESVHNQSVSSLYSRYESFGNHECIWLSGYLNLTVILANCLLFSWSFFAELI